MPEFGIVEDTQNPMHLPICVEYLKKFCVRNTEWDSDFAPFENFYWDIPQNQNGCYCKMFKNEYFCPFSKWMKNNRIERGLIK